MASNKQINPEKLIITKIEELSSKSNLLIAIGGPGGTGKSTLAERLNNQIPDSGILKLDNYKTPRKSREKLKIFGAHPDANNIGLIIDHLQDLKKGKKIEMPLYDNKLGQAKKSETITPKRVILVDGEISTYQDIIKHMDLSIFIDSHWKTQLNTRLTRDIDIRGYTPRKAIETFLHSNLIEFKEHGEHTKEWCDIHLFCDHEYNLCQQ